MPINIHRVLILIKRYVFDQNHLVFIADRGSHFLKFLAIALRQHGIWTLKETGGTGRVLIRIVVGSGSVHELSGLARGTALAGRALYRVEGRLLRSFLEELAAIAQLAVFNLMWILPRMQLTRLPFVEHPGVGRGDARRHLRLLNKGRLGRILGQHGLHLEVHRNFFIDSSRSLLARLRRLLLLSIPHGFGVPLAFQRLVVSCFLDYGRNGWKLLLVSPGLILGLAQRYLAGRPLEASWLPHARRRDTLRLGRAHRVDVASLSTRLVAPLGATHLVL